jgi:hypothetical protein
MLTANRIQTDHFKEADRVGSMPYIRPALATPENAGDQHVWPIGSLELRDAPTSPTGSVCAFEAVSDPFAPEETRQASPLGSGQGAEGVETGQVALEGRGKRDRGRAVAGSGAAGQLAWSRREEAILNRMLGERVARGSVTRKEIIRLLPLLPGRTF